MLCIYWGRVDKTIGTYLFDQHKWCIFSASNGRSVLTIHQLYIIGTTSVYPYQQLHSLTASNVWLKTTHTAPFCLKTWVFASAQAAVWPIPTLGLCISQSQGWQNLDSSNIKDNLQAYMNMKYQRYTGRSMLWETHHSHCHSSCSQSTLLATPSPNTKWGRTCFETKLGCRPKQRSIPYHFSFTISYITIVPETPR
jgi:hypothetical protein